MSMSDLSEVKRPIPLELAEAIVKVADKQALAVLALLNRDISHTSIGKLYGNVILNSPRKIQLFWSSGAAVKYGRMVKKLVITDSAFKQTNDDVQDPALRQDSRSLPENYEWFQARVSRFLRFILPQLTGMKYLAVPKHDITCMYIFTYRYTSTLR